MTAAETTSESEFGCASETQRTLKDLRVKRKGQPVYVLGHDEQYKGQEGVFESFNVRLAVVKFANGKSVGFDPLDLLLPCEIHENGEAYFEIRYCDQCDQVFPLTAEEFWAEREPETCPECAL
ncbi:MAG: hypothetical protein NPIRA02_07430 [Nitrospirales bacterium]|nr:MAG: hypothetical protein NPIRA02_07430 [Nitrospirales bacterium]